MWYEQCVFGTVLPNFTEGDILYFISVTISQICVGILYEVRDYELSDAEIVILQRNQSFAALGRDH